MRILIKSKLDEFIDSKKIIYIIEKMSDKTIRITLTQARKLFLKRQLLTNPELPKGKDGALFTIEKLGYIQIDTINVVERSHHLVIFTRCPDYKKEYLHELQAQDKKIFEYWAHAASFIPMKDYRYYLRAIEKKPKPDSRLEKWIKEHRILIKKVRERVAKNGPLTTSDFEDSANRKRGTWWDWKPAKMALEVLFWQGVLMIKERRKFQRVYDLTERVLPKNLDITKPSEEEEKKFFVRRALGVLGIATEKDINRYIGVSGKLNKWINDMLKSNEILKTEIVGLKKPYYILVDDLAELTQAKKEIDSKVRFLSPFDNSIILRDLTRDFLEFNYSLECYVPKNKRKYGYFCLPILWQNQLVGLIDPKVDRKEKTLIINNLHIMDRNLDHKKFMPSFCMALRDFMIFHNCERVQCGKPIPPEFKQVLLKYPC